MIMGTVVIQKNNVVDQKTAGWKEGGVNEQQIEFLRTLYSQCKKGYIEFRSLPLKKQQWVPVNNVSIPVMPEGNDIYFGVATRSNGGSTKDDIIEIPALWVDIDFKNTNIKDAQERLEKIAKKPTIHVRSGFGWHLYWVLKKPVEKENIKIIEDLNKALSRYFNGDAASAEAARILRLPRTYNYKYNPPRQVAIKYMMGNLLYEIGEFDFLKQNMSTPPAIEVSNWHVDLLKGVKEGERNNTAAKLTGRYLNKGLTPDEIYCLLMTWNKRNIPEGLQEKEINNVISSLSKNHKIQAFDKGDEIDGLHEIIKNSIVDMTKFLTIKVPEKQLILRPWLSEGNLVLIAADRGIGKTWLALSIAAAVTGIISIGDWKSDKSHRCLYIDGEMSVYELQKRIAELLKNSTGNRSQLSLISADSMKASGKTAPNLGNKQWRNEFLKIIREKNYKVVIIDNLASLTPGIDENKKQDWDQFDQWLLELRALNVAVIMIHHAGKSGEQRGTSAREDHLDVSIKLTRPQGYKTEDGARFDVEFTKSRSFYGKDAGSVRLRLDLSKYKDIWVVENTRNSKETDVIMLLGNSLKPKIVARHLNCTASYVSQVRKKAIENGILNQDRTFTDIGRARYEKMERSPEVKAWLGESLS
jgi:hypothetical protein